jgi:type IV pilus assembly protein PilP
MNLRNLRSLLLYSVAGLGGIALAVWLSSPFGGKAFSQTPPDMNTTNQTPPGPPLPAAPPTSAAPNPQGTPPPVTGVLQTGSQITTIVPDVKGKAKPANLAGETKIPDLLVGIIEDYNYTPAGKRDPFTPFERSTNTTTMGPIWPLQKYDLEQLKLVGVIWEVKIPKAMILDPSGHGYVVTVNERIGRNNGYIARIREGEIVVVENILGSDGKATYVTKLMKLNPQ